MTPPAIEVSHLTRSFGSLVAVDDISFRIESGQVAGFIGSNGAGKTTTMRILATLDAPTSGHASILGHHVRDAPAQVRRQLGWMPDDFGAYDHMTVLEYLDFFARAYGFRGNERKERVEEIVSFTELGPLSDRFLKGLSKGMAQRLCLGRSLIHDPGVLILDEPAAGLDPKARIELKQLIRLLAEEGKTILISSHILSELGEMCDTLLFINRGKIVHQGDPSSLQHRKEVHGVVRVSLVSPDWEALSDWAATSPGVRLLDETKTGARIEVESPSPEVLARVLTRMLQAGLPVCDFHREERRLEDAFIEMVSESEASFPKPPPPPPAS
ncbi:MAG: ABC transporter ATP-binding protein [Verrucomicrobiota bacterium]